MSAVNSMFSLTNELSIGEILKNIRISNISYEKLEKLYLYCMLQKYYKSNPQKINMRQIINDNYVPSDLNKTINNLRKVHKKFEEKNTDKINLYSDSSSKGKAERILKLLNKNVKGYNKNTPKSILDFGGGNGKILEYLGKIFNIDNKNLYLSDIDEWSGKEWSKDRNKDINFIPSKELQKSKVKVDLIVVSHTLHHIKDEDLHEYIKSFERILNKDGILVLVEHDIDMDIKRRLVDLKHYIYDLIIDQIDTYSKYMKKYYSNYKSLNEWSKLLGKLKFVRYEKIHTSVDWTYFAFYKKQ